MTDDYPLLDREPVEVRSPSAETWHLLGGLQDAFPSGWVLIGGLMVYLLAAEAGQTPTRVTADADVLVRVKVLANGTIRIAVWCRSLCMVDRCDQRVHSLGCIREAVDGEPGVGNEGVPELVEFR